jgi:serine/threonine-protein kinase RsbT
MSRSTRLDVASRTDVERARRDARNLASGLGFVQPELEAVCLAVAELAMNLAAHSDRGEITLTTQGQPGAYLEVEALDLGPGIADLDEAMRDGFSTGSGLGNGLGAVRRLMDDFSISSGPEGTRVVARKWLSRPS